MRAKEKLESQGHILVHLDKVDNTKLFKLLGEIFGCDQAKTMARSLKLDETKPATVKRIIQFSEMSPLLVKLVNWTLRKEPRVSLDPEKSGEQLMDINIRLEEEISKFYSLLQEAEVDAILCPLHAFPATSPAYFPYGIPTNYLGVFNMCGFVSGTVPFGFVSEEDAKEEYKGDGIEDAVTKGIRKTMAGSAGLPVAVQLASFPGRDELIVALMKQLEERKEKKEKDSIAHEIRPKI